MPGYKELLELRLEHAATPERVARATRLLADIVLAVLPDPDPEGDDDEGVDGRPLRVTVVVSNRDTAATVRVWEPSAELPIQALADFIRAPTAEGDFVPAVAHALSDYAKTEGRYHPAFWGPQNQRLRSVDEKFAEELEGIARKKRTRAPRVLGATYINSRVFRVGQKDLAAAFKARLLFPDGQFREIAVDQAQHRAFIEAHEAGDRDKKEYRIKLVGVWLRRGDRLELDEDNQLRATGIDDRVSTGDGQQLIAAVNADAPIKRGELRGVLRHLDPDDDE